MCQTLYRLPLWVLVAPKAAFVFSKQPAGAGVSNVDTLQTNKAYAFFCGGQRTILSESASKTTLGFADKYIITLTFCSDPRKMFLLFPFPPAPSFLFLSSCFSSFLFSSVRHPIGIVREGIGGLFCRFVVPTLFCAGAAIKDGVLIIFLGFVNIGPNHRKHNKCALV